MHDGYISISQICQYHIWDVLTIWVRSEKQSVVWKKQLNDGNHGQRTHSVKIGADSLAEITPNTPKFI